MAAIYCADIYCDDCARDIKERIVADFIDGKGYADLLSLVDPDDLHDCLQLSARDEAIAGIIDLLDDLGGYGFDSDEYPKDCSDDEESDVPQHCGSHTDCLNPETLADGTTCSHFFGNALTTDGEEYVKEYVREARAAGETDGVVLELWAKEYDYIDFGDEDEDEDEEE